MAVSLHVLADDRAIQHIERGEQRGRSVPPTVKEIPLRMRQTRMPRHNTESQTGLFWSDQSTRRQLLNARKVQITGDR